MKVFATPSPPRTESDVAETRAAAARMPHRQHVPEELRHDHRAGTLLGAMYLNKHITIAQYEAGVRLRELVMTWQAMWGAPQFEQGATPLDGDQHGGGADIPHDVAVRIGKAYRQAHKIVRQSVGERGVVAVWRTCVFDQHIEQSELRYVKSALRALVVGLARK